MGAWIEIAYADARYFLDSVAPFMGAWIEINAIVKKLQLAFIVAPFMGAWIEIRFHDVASYDNLSHPSWVRGLKLPVLLEVHGLGHVAPFMGAWIEITWRLRLVRILTSLTFHGKKEC